MENQEIDNMTPVEAGNELETIYADTNGPYFNTDHRRHEPMVERVGQLIKIRDGLQQPAEGEGEDLEQVEAREAQETAQKEIDKIRRNRNHPYFHEGHAGHEAALKKMDELYHLAYPSGSKESESETESEDEEEADRQVLINEAKSEMDRLVELGCKPDDIPDDIQAWQVRGLKEQRFCMEEDRDSLMPMLEEDVEELANSPETSQLFEKYLMPASGGVEAVRWWLQGGDLRKEAGYKITMAIIEAFWDIQRERKRR